MAEREGFEPPIALRLCLISSQVHSTGLCHLSAVNLRMVRSTNKPVASHTCAAILSLVVNHRHGNAARLPEAEESRTENAAYDSQNDDGRSGARMTTDKAYWSGQPAGAGQGITALRRTIGGE